MMLSLQAGWESSKVAGTSCPVPRGMHHPGTLAPRPRSMTSLNPAALCTLPLLCSSSSAGLCSAGPWCYRTSSLRAPGDAKAILLIPCSRQERIPHQTPTGNSEPAQLSSSRALRVGESPCDYKQPGATEEQVHPDSMSPLIFLR